MKLLSVYNIIVCCICVNNANVEDTHPTKVPEADYSRITNEVSTNLNLLYLEIHPFSLSPYICPSSGRRFPFCLNPMYFGFVDHCRYSILCLAHIHPLLLQEIITEIYTLPPPPLAMERIIQYKWFDASTTFQGGVL